MRTLAILLTWTTLAASGPSSPAQEIKDSWYRKGDRLAYLHTAYLQEVDGGPIEYKEMRGAVGWYLGPRFAVFAEAHLGRFSGERNGTKADATAAGASIFFRWHMIMRQRFGLYLEQGWGFVLTDRAFPPGGTKANGALPYGIGLHFPINKKMQGTLSWRAFHLSNGQGNVPENPSLDTTGLVLGTQFRF